MKKSNFFLIFVESPHPSITNINTFRLSFNMSAILISNEDVSTEYNSNNLPRKYLLLISEPSLLQDHIFVFKFKRINTFFLLRQLTAYVITINNIQFFSSGSYLLYSCCNLPHTFSISQSSSNTSNTFIFP